MLPLRLLSLCIRLGIQPDKAENALSSSLRSVWKYSVYAWCVCWGGDGMCYCWCV